MSLCCCVRGLEDSDCCVQGSLLPSLFRRDGSWQEKSSSISSVRSKKKLPQASIHFLRKIRSIKGVTEAYTSDKRTTFVKLENQRIVCLKGYNANPLYDCLREMYRAQESEQFLRYLQGSRSGGASPSERPRDFDAMPAAAFGVSCSDNLRDYVLKKKCPGRGTPGSTGSKSSLMSGSQSSLDGTNSKTSPKGIFSRQLSQGSAKSQLTARTDKFESGSNSLSRKVPLLQKALQELKGTGYNNKKYRRAALRHIDQYMRDSFNTDFAQLFTDSSDMISSGVYADEDDDIYTSSVSHQTLKQYKNLPFKELFPPLTTFSDESDDEDRTQALDIPDSAIPNVSSEFTSLQISSCHGQGRNSDQTDIMRVVSEDRLRLSPPAQRRHTISNTQNITVMPRFIKVYQPGRSRPIFISGATTLGGLPEPHPISEQRLSERLKHKPFNFRNIALEQAASKNASNSCPLICDVGESKAQVATAYGRKTSSLSESFLCRTANEQDRSDNVQSYAEEYSLKTRRAQKAKQTADSQYESSLQMDRSLQEANDLVRTLFDNISINAPAPVITVASTSITRGQLINATSAPSTVDATLPTSNLAPDQFSESTQPRSSSSSESAKNISSNSEERNTVKIAQ